MGAGPEDEGWKMTARHLVIASAMLLIWATINGTGLLLTTDSQLLAGFYIAGFPVAGAAGFLIEFLLDKRTVSRRQVTTERRDHD